MKIAQSSWKNVRILLVLWSAFQLMVVKAETNENQKENTMLTLLEKTNLKFVINGTLGVKTILENQEPSTNNETNALANPLNSSAAADPESREEVTRQFEEAFRALEALRGMVNEKKNKKSVQSSRLIRSHLNKNSKCTVSINKLTELKNGINDVLSSTTAKPSDINCNFNSDDANNCNELIKLIQCGINHIKNGFLKAMSDANSIHEVTKWKNAYDSLSQKYEREMDDFKKSLSESHKQQLEESKTELQNLQREFNNVLQRLRDTTIKLCISEIDSGRIDNAVGYFFKLNQPVFYEEVSDMIETAYDYRRPENILKFLQFIEKLPMFGQRAIAYRKLYDKLKESDDFGCYNALLLLQAVTGTIGMYDDPDANSWLIDLKNKMKDSFPNECLLVLDVVSEINNGKIDDAINHKNNIRIIWHYDLIVEVIGIAYNEGKPDNFKNILSFISKMRWYGHRVICFNRLFFKMKQNKDLNCDRLSQLQTKVNGLGKPKPDDPDAWSWLENLKKEIKLFKAPCEFLKRNMRLYYAPIKKYK